MFMAAEYETIFNDNMYEMASQWLSITLVSGFQRNSLPLNCSALQKFGWKSHLVNFLSIAHVYFFCINSLLF